MVVPGAGLVKGPPHFDSSKAHAIFPLRSSRWTPRRTRPVPGVVLTDPAKISANSFLEETILTFARPRIAAMIFSRTAAAAGSGPKSSTYKAIEWAFLSGLD